MHGPGSAIAVVTDIHVPDIAYTPYQRPPQSATITTPIPRGLKSFVVRGAVTAVKPINDDLLLEVPFTLPSGFGYLLNEVHLNVNSNQAGQMEAFAVFSLFQTSSANRNFDYRQPIAMELGGIGGTSNNFRMSRIAAGNLTRVPIVPPAAGANGILSYTDRFDPAATAGTIDALISFWEYDLEQIVYFPVHMAANVVGR